MTASPPDQTDFSGATTLTAASPQESIDAATAGTWGERDSRGQVSHLMAMEEYEQLRRELTQLSKARSRSTTRTGRTGIFRTATGWTTKSRRTVGTGTRRRESAAADASADEDEDLEAGDAAGEAEEKDEFPLGDFIREGHFEKRTGDGESTKKVGVVFKNLTVKGLGASASFVRTLPDAILGEIVE